MAVIGYVTLNNFLNIAVFPNILLYLTTSSGTYLSVFQCNDATSLIIGQAEDPLGLAVTYYIVLNKYLNNAVSATHTLFPYLTPLVILT
jgi:hypothetical protein